MKGLSPLIVFATFYVVASIVAGDFYRVPITVAFLVASLYAIAISGPRPLVERINIYSGGAATADMLLMVWIFVLAGAFAASAKAIGSIDATVNLTVSVLPSRFLLAGIFLAACFISLSVGTSVGTIVALTPIAAGVADETGASVAMLTGVVVGGSFFGDNLSFISDTTIVATQSQGCRLADKFRVNIFIVAPAALFILLLYIYKGEGMSAPQTIAAVEPLKVLPYIVVLVTALMGMNVMAVLALGLMLTGIVGLATGTIGFFDWLVAIGNGITGMGELIIITLMAGGLLQLIKEMGGIDTIIRLLTRRVSGKRGAELSIAALVSIVNICTANNTVAIITVGGIARQIGDRFGVDNRKCASLLDTFSCFTQGMLPYGAQVLMAAGLAALSPMAILPYLYYPLAIGLCALMAILLRYPKRYS